MSKRERNKRKREEEKDKNTETEITYTNCVHYLTPFQITIQIKKFAFLRPERRATVRI